MADQDFDNRRKAASIQGVLQSHEEETSKEIAAIKKNLENFIDPDGIAINEFLEKEGLGKLSSIELNKAFGALKDQQTQTIDRQQAPNQLAQTQEDKNKDDSERG